MPLLGIQPLLGRTFTPADCAPGAPLTVLLSENLWRVPFHSDQHILGREIRIRNVPHIVIGVMPVGFAFPDQERPDSEKGIWIPWQPTAEMRQGREFTVCQMIGRLRPELRNSRPERGWQPSPRIS